MKSSKANREEVLKEFATNAANWINGHSLVNDDWMNAVKTYQNTEFTDEELRRIYMLLMCMYIDLAMARLEDVLEPREKSMFEKAIIEHIAYIEYLLRTKPEIEEEEFKTTLENAFYSLLEIYRTNQKQQGLTIPQNYLAYLLNASHGKKLTEEIWSEYINDHVKMFEERNFRTQLTKILDKLTE